MKMVVYTINLKDDPKLIEEYKTYHKNIWDEVKAGLKEAGIRKNWIYLLGTRLVNIMEVDDNYDPENSIKDYYKSRPKVEEWAKLMATYQEPVPEARPDEWWAQMEKIFEFISED